MKRFDNNGKPLPDNEQDFTTHHYNGDAQFGEHVNSADINEDPMVETIIQSNINGNATLPIEQINGFEVARRAIVTEMAKSNHPAVGAGIAGIAYAVEAFFGTIKEDKGRKYGS